MGLLVQPANYQAALTEGLGTSGGGVSHLLSDGYGVNPAVATGWAWRCGGQAAKC